MERQHGGDSGWSASQTWHHATVRCSRDSSVRSGAQLDLPWASSTPGSVASSTTRRRRVCRYRTP